MPRPATKKDLLAAATENFEKLNLLISNMTAEELARPFDFSRMRKRKKPTGSAIGT